MRGEIRLDTLSKRDQNYVNGVCYFCGGDRFASHILVIRPQRGLVINQKEQEIKFCDECFKELQNVVACDDLSPHKSVKTETKQKDEKGASKMPRLVVYVVTTFHDADGNVVQSNGKMVHFLKNEDGSTVREADAKRWFERAYPMDGKSEKQPDGTFVGYRRHNLTKGYAQYVMSIEGLRIVVGPAEAIEG